MIGDDPGLRRHWRGRVQAQMIDIRLRFPETLIQGQPGSFQDQQTHIARDAGSDFVKTGLFQGRGHLIPMLFDGFPILILFLAAGPVFALLVQICWILTEPIRLRVNPEQLAFGFRGFGSY